MNNAYKKIIMLSLTLLLSQSIHAGISGFVAGAITRYKGKQDGVYTIDEVKDRLSEIIEEFLKNPNKKPSITIDDLAEEFGNNGWEELEVWILTFSDRLLQEKNKQNLTEKKIGALGRKLAIKSFGSIYNGKLIQVQTMLAEIQLKFEKDPTIKSIDWYEILKHRRGMTIDSNVITINNDAAGNTVIQETNDHAVFDENGFEQSHDRTITTTHLTQ
ncbi:hypothetical protein K9K77_01440 [Candidatus Babeliales bacterium]|nr:hypothetical protein [Candidatus Babeliales bacterium]